jgi:AhpD family alkylhydroperoxidase
MSTATAVFNVPTRDEVSAANQAQFDALTKGLGSVPNLYAVMALSDHALINYLAFQGAKTTFSNKEKQAVNLIVSQVNECLYCQAAHTYLGKLNGMTEDQTIEVRRGGASFDARLDALVKAAKELTLNRGKVSQPALDAFFAAGYNKGQIVELIMLVAEKTAMNYVHAVTQVPIDFPEAQAI